MLQVKKYSEEELVSLLQNKDAQAFNYLYDNYCGALYGIIYKMIENKELAEDILQEAFVKVFKYLRQYEGKGELGAWIRKIMVTTAINYLKRHTRYQTDLSFNDMGMHPVSTDNPAVRVDARDLADLIRQLPPGYQTIFNLHAVEGYTHVEIGKMLGISEGTSRSQYSRARALLISWLEKQSVVQKKTKYAGK